ncbi:hypothetical protein D1872_81490 [compost metagenome]
MAQKGFVTANLYNPAEWNLNDPVKIEILVRAEGDSRPDVFYGLVYQINPMRLTVLYMKPNLEKQLDYIPIESINSGTIQVFNLADELSVPPTP